MSSASIPVIDAEALSSDEFGGPAVHEALRTAFGEYGILHLAGHGLRDDWLDELYATFAGFCAQSAEAKQELSRPDLWFQRGWTPPNTEVAIAGGGQPDFKECFFAACTEIAPGDRELWPQIQSDNVWPKHGCAEFPERYARVALRLQELGELVLAGCERALDLERGTIVELLRGGPHVTRLLRYLPLETSNVESGVLWGENHTDFCALTLLPGGRFVGVDGERIDDPRDGTGLFLTTRGGAHVSGSPPAGCITVQVGQQLEILTGGVLLATPHEIRAPRTAGISRFSGAHFMHLHPGRTLFPLEPFRTRDAVTRYRPPVLAGTYDLKILVDIGLAPADAIESLGYPNQARIGSQSQRAD